MKLALLLVLVAPLSGIAQSPATVAAHRAALADAPTDSGLRDGLASARAEVAYPPGLTPPRLGGVRHAVAPLDLLVLSIASAVTVTVGAVAHKLGRRRRGAAAVALGVVGWSLTLGLSVETERERRFDEARPAVVVAEPAMLRGGNGPNFPSRWPVPLPPGVEGVTLHRRGGWVQLRLDDGTPDGLIGWLPEACVLSAVGPTRIRP